MKLGNRNSQLSVGQRRARLKLLNASADAGSSLRAAAKVVHLSSGGLHHWLCANDPELLERLSTNGKAKRRRPLAGGGSDLTRLRLVYMVGPIEAAAQLDLTPQAIYVWLRRNFPGGRAAWLAELQGRV